MTLGPLMGITLVLMKNCVRLRQEFSGSSSEPEREAPEKPSPLKARLETKQNPVGKKKKGIKEVNQEFKPRNSTKKTPETIKVQFFYYLNEGGVPQTRSQLNCCTIKALQGAL